MTNGYDPKVPPPPNLSATEDKASGMAITALILGILSPFCCGLLSGIPAVIIGWMERSKIQRGESSAKGSGFALTGIILGAIGIVFGIIGLIVWILMVIAESSRGGW